MDLQIQLHRCLPLPTNPTKCVTGRNGPTATMATTYERTFPPHPDKTIASPDAAFGSLSKVAQGVFTIASSHGSETFHYLVTDLSFLPGLHEEKKQLNFDRFYWTPWTADLETWNRLRPRAPIKRVVPLPETTAAPSQPPTSIDNEEVAPGEDEAYDADADASQQEAITPLNDVEAASPKAPSKHDAGDININQTTETKLPPPPPPFKPPQFGDYDGTSQWQPPPNTFGFKAPPLTTPQRPMDLPPQQTKAASPSTPLTQSPAQQQQQKNPPSRTSFRVPGQQPSPQQTHQQQHQ